MSEARAIPASAINATPELIVEATSEQEEKVVEPTRRTSAKILQEEQIIAKMINKGVFGEGEKIEFSNISSNYRAGLTSNNANRYYSDKQRKKILAIYIEAMKDIFPLVAQKKIRVKEGHGACHCANTPQQMQTFQASDGVKKFFTLWENTTAHGASAFRQYPGTKLLLENGKELCTIKESDLRNKIHIYSYFEVKERATTEKRADSNYKGTNLVTVRQTTSKEENYPLDLADMVFNQGIYLHFNPYNIDEEEVAKIMKYVAEQYIILHKAEAKKRGIRKMQEESKEALIEGFVKGCNVHIKKKKKKMEREIYSISRKVTELIDTFSSLQAQQGRIEQELELYEHKSFDIINEKYSKEANKLLNMSKIAKIRTFENDNGFTILQVRTTPLFCRDPRTKLLHFLGEIEIKIPMTGNFADVTVNPINQLPSIAKSKGLVCPHSPAGKGACYGNIGAALSFLAKNYKYAEYVGRMIRFMESANTNDMWGERVIWWPAVDEKTGELIKGLEKGCKSPSFIWHYLFTTKDSMRLTVMTHYWRDNVRDVLGSKWMTKEEMEERGKIVLSSSDYSSLYTFLNN